MNKTLKEMNHIIRWSSVVQSHPSGDTAMPVVTPCFGKSWCSNFWSVTTRLISTESVGLLLLHHRRQDGRTCTGDGRVQVMAFDQGTDRLKVIGVSIASSEISLLTTVHAVFFSTLWCPHVFFPSLHVFNKPLIHKTFCLKQTAELLELFQTMFLILRTSKILSR